MAYTKNTWKTGDIVSSQKLNHMEDGIVNSGSVFFINATDNTIESESGEGSLITLDKTWQEIYDAHSSGALCVIRYSGNTGNRSITVVEVGNSPEPTWDVFTVNNGFRSATPDEYPIQTLLLPGELSGDTTIIEGPNIL